jgi:hypothetical protein
VCLIFFELMFLGFSRFRKPSSSLFDCAAPVIFGWRLLAWDGGWWDETSSAVQVSLLQEVIPV